MKTLIRMLSVILLILFGFSTGAFADPERGIVRAGGSTTLLPIIVKCASDFMEKYKTWDKVDASFPPDDIVVFVSGGGSGFGIRSAINGTVQIGLASRNLKEKEKKILGQHTTFLVGKDAVVIAANRDNPISSVKEAFTSIELAEIFSGNKRLYSEINASLPDQQIVLLVRDSGAGSAEMFQDLIMKDLNVSADALQLPSQGALLKKLETNKAAIGYISSGLANSSDKLKSFSLEDVYPSNENVINGSYSFTRPLFMVTKGSPDVRVKHFIDYVLGEGQAVVKASHYVPVASLE